MSESLWFATKVILSVSGLGLLVYFLFGTDLESKSASKFDNS